MALGDFIGSLQFYPWRERMVMPPEEPVKERKTSLRARDRRSAGERPARSGRGMKRARQGKGRSGGRRPRKRESKL